jgi:hypothetical protein
MMQERKIHFLLINSIFEDWRSSQKFDKVIYCYFSKIYLSANNSMTDEIRAYSSPNAIRFQESQREGI